jgi:anaerobic ribonucleoside-triphosphate reductase activating protein
MPDDHPPLRLAAFLPRSRANGPGLRAVLWVQGCKLRCPGCFNADFLPLDGGTLHDPAEIAEWTLAEQEIEGLTFSGGEPFLQGLALAELARLVRTAAKSVVIFTGFDWDELEHSTDPGHRALLSQADTLIAGPYRQELPSPHPYLASANQRLVHLTGRYRNEDFTTDRGRRVEFHIKPGGDMSVSGFPNPVLRDAVISHAKLAKDAKEEIGMKGSRR